MFIPKYLITNSILKHIGSIDGGREVINHAELIPAWLTKLRHQALTDSTYYGSILEGVSLTEEQVHQLIAGDNNDDSNWQFNQSLFKALREVNELEISLDRPNFLTLETVLELQRLISGDEQFREAEIVIRNAQTGQISYSPPPAAEIPYLIDDLIDWLNSDVSIEVHPVLRSAIAHFEIYRIQPFSGNNEAVGRLLSHLILRIGQYDLKGFLSLESYFAATQLEYYQILQSAANQKVLDVHERDLTLWLEYFSRGVAIQVDKLKEIVLKVASESHQKDQLGEEVVLNERQMAIIEYLNKHAEMRNKDFRKIFPDFSDDTVLRELKFLKQKGLVKKEGNTKRAIYVLGVST